MVRCTVQDSSRMVQVQFLINKTFSIRTVFTVQAKILESEPLHFGTVREWFENGS